MKLIMDLVQTTSDEHEWFQTAIHEPDSKYGSYYIFSMNQITGRFSAAVHGNT